jgi:hypothetical protein
MLKRLKQAWKRAEQAYVRAGWSPNFASVQRDPLAALGIGSAAVAFLLWAIPGADCFGSGYSCNIEWFSPERLPAVAAFLALSVILLIVRAGNRR